MPQPRLDLAPNRPASSARLVVLATGSAFALLLLAASSAGAQCLTGPSPTGFESGNHTLSVSLPNMSVDSTIVGISCIEGFGDLAPGMTANGTGHARFIANSKGHRASTAVLVGGQGSGNSGATALGSARYVVRATSSPSYTGPAQVDLDVSLQADVSGSVSVSGVGSAGGSYTTEVSLRPLDSQIGVILFASNNALAPGGTVQLQGTTPIDVDRDYVLQITATQNVTASFAPGGMGQPSSAASSGAVAISFETALAVPDSDLTIEYPMVGILGVPPPGLGNPPNFPGYAPAMGVFGQLVVTLALIGVGLVGLRRRSVSAAT